MFIASGTMTCVAVVKKIFFAAKDVRRRGGLRNLRRDVDVSLI